MVLTITRNLRQIGVVGKFVEFYGSGVSALSIADRATISNMCPEYGATVGYFPVDFQSIEYLRLTGREESAVVRIEQYLRAVGMFRDFSDSKQVSSNILTNKQTIKQTTNITLGSGILRDASARPLFSC